MFETSIAEIAERYLSQIKRTGSENIMAACPFHSDGHQKTPSFTMSLTRGLYFCFSCGERGNLKTFLRAMGIPRLLIEREYAGLLEEVATNRPEPKELWRGPTRIEPLPESLLGLFDYCPIDMLKEGFKEDLLKAYDIGFDKAHMRITFPLRDLEGKLIGISGRTVTGEFPRYKIYDREFMRWGLGERRLEKREVLWNAERVYPRTFFEKDAIVFLVEGFKACLWMAQAGFKDTMAVLGTYVSEEQRFILERIGADVVLLLDNDEWGRRATVRVGEVLTKSLRVRVADYSTEKKQPTDLTKNEIMKAVSESSDFHIWVTREENRKWRMEKTRPSWTG